MTVCLRAGSFLVAWVPRPRAVDVRDRDVALVLVAMRSTVPSGRAGPGERHSAAVARIDDVAGVRRRVDLDVGRAHPQGDDLADRLPRRAVVLRVDLDQQRARRAAVRVTY